MWNPAMNRRKKLFLNKKHYWVAGGLCLLALLLIVGRWWQNAADPQDVFLSSVAQEEPQSTDTLPDGRPSSPDSHFAPAAQGTANDPAVADTGSAENITDAIMGFVNLEPGRIGPQQARDWADRIKASDSIDRDGLIAAMRSDDLDAQLIGVYLWFERFGYTEDLRDAVLRDDLNVPIASEVLFQLFVREDFAAWEALVVDYAEQQPGEALFEFLMQKNTPVDTLPTGQAAGSLQLGHGAGLFFAEMAKRNVIFRRLLQTQVENDASMPVSQRRDWMELLFKASSFEATEMAKRIMSDPGQDDLMYFAALRELIKAGEDPDLLFDLLPREHPFRHRFRRVATRYASEDSGPSEVEIRHVLGDLNHEPNPQLAFMIASSLSNDQLAKLSSRDLRNVSENLVELPVPRDYLRARINYVLRQKGE